MAIDNDWAIEVAKEIEKTDLKVLIISEDTDLVEKARNMDLHSIEGEILKVLDYGTIDLANYSKFLAVTKNDSYNALICQTVAHKFGSSNVYQLPFSEKGSTSPESLPEALRGRFINKKLNYVFICKLVSEGAHFLLINGDDFDQNNKNSFLIFSFSEAFEISSQREEKAAQVLVLQTESISQNV